MIYIASPYSHQIPAIVQERYLLTAQFTAIGFGYGHPVLSPIVHCHNLALVHRLPTDFAYWQHYNENLINTASALVVLCLPDWEESLGVVSEIELTQKKGLPLLYASPVPGEVYHNFCHRFWKEYNSFLMKALQKLAEEDED